MPAVAAVGVAWVAVDRAVGAVEGAVGELDGVELVGDELLGRAEAVVAVEEPTFLYRRSLGLAAEFGLGSTYDALYLALAESEGCEMWTADLRLCRAVDDRFSLLRCLGL